MNYEQEKTTATTTNKTSKEKKKQQQQHKMHIIIVVGTKVTRTATIIIKIWNNVNGEYCIEIKNKNKNKTRIGTENQITMSRNLR